MAQSEAIRQLELGSLVNRGCDVFMTTLISVADSSVRSVQPSLSSEEWYACWSSDSAAVRRSEITDANVFHYIRLLTKRMKPLIQLAKRQPEDGNRSLFPITMVFKQPEEQVA
jgi:hypothetical protein